VQIKRPFAGFSVCEILIAAAIGAIVTAGVVPFSVHIVHWIRLRSSAHDFVRELHRARLLAIAQGAPVKVEVHRADGSYRLVSTAASLGVLGSECHNAEGVLFRTLPSRSLAFHPWGTASPAGSYVLAGRAGGVRIVVSLTGRVRTEEVDP
jgi:Tfp pilus assembly protein FimT